LARLSPADEAAVSSPLLNASGVKVWYARHPSLAPLDPIELAVRSLADAPSQAYLPQKADDIAGYKGIIVALPRLSAKTNPVIETQHLRTTLGGTNIPILCLCASNHGAQAPADSNCELLEYPCSLAKLHQFISKICT
jgi:hypothetical protein